MLKTKMVQGNKLCMIFGRAGVFVNVTFSQLETKKIKEVFKNVQ